MVEATFDGLDTTILEFCRFGRANGLLAGVKESLGALEAARAIGIADREVLKIALRAVLCSSKADWNLFEEIFEEFWSTSGQNLPPSTRRKKRFTSAQERQSQERAGSILPSDSNAAASDDQVGKAVLGATAHERFKHADFAHVSLSDLPDLERLALRLLRQMSLRLSRRLKVSRLSDKVDLRRTIRRSVSRGGDPINLSFRGRKLEQQRLVILLDISGSMNPYSLFLVRFAYALEKYLRRVDTFLFSTRITDITSVLHARHLRDALHALSQQAAGWSGGTKIGDSLREFSFQQRRLLSRNTLFMVLSDGWDTGEPETLAAEMAVIKRRVRKVIWLNPLLGMEGYQPVTRGMSAALPYIDVFAPAHNLQSLLALEGHLRGG